MSADPDLVWNIRELRECVGLRHGDAYAERVWEPLQSVVFRIRAMHYHAVECVRLTHNTDGLLQQDAGAIAFLKAMLDCAGTDSDSIRRQHELFSAEAHAIASAQAAHACLDIFAHVLYWALALDQTKPLKDRDICFSKILEHISQDPKVAAVFSMADALHNAPQTAYLCAYVNTVKHRRLIRARPSVRFEDAPGHGLRIKAFNYDSKTHGGKFPEKWVHDFLFEDNVYVLQNLVRTGNALSRLLR